MVAAGAVCGNVELFVVVEHFQHIIAGWSVDDGRGDELVHGFVVVGTRWVVQETGAAAGDRAGQDGNAEGTGLGDGLEGANEVRAFEVLEVRLVWLEDDDGSYLLTFVSCVH